MNKRRGKKARVYTKERVKEVKRRIKNEFLTDVAKDMGMDPRNLARYCRNNGIKLFSKAALKANYRRRNYSRKESKRTLEIKAQITKGLTSSAIAAEFGVTRQYIYNLRNKMKKCKQLK